MGLNKQSFAALNTALNSYNKYKLQSSLIELGIQASYDDLGFSYLRDVLSKDYGEYISLDLHPINGVTICDLSIHQPLLFSADIITNIGTSEHVEYEKGQYNCWLNIHNWLNLGGIMIHELPEIESWKGHCRYFVDEPFFRNHQNYGYEILEIMKHNSSQGDLIWCVMRKNCIVPYMKYDEFFKYMHIDKSISLINIPNENNPKNLL